MLLLKMLNALITASGKYFMIKYHKPITACALIIQNTASSVFKK